jgi:hypothetical protein
MKLFFLFLFDIIFYGFICVYFRKFLLKQKVTFEFSNVTFFKRCLYDIIFYVFIFFIFENFY